MINTKLQNLLEFSCFLKCKMVFNKSIFLDVINKD